MNIVLEGNINFYDELNKLDTDDEDENEPLCLLTNLPLDKNSIKLSCNHEFNFLPLYKEVVQQKTRTNSSYLNTDKLAYNQIKCPYCRQKTENLLPHVRLNKDMSFISGVNTPESLCMKFHTCNYLFKSGKNKDNCCSKQAYFDVEGCFCSTHHAYALKQKQKNASKMINQPTSVKNTNNNEPSAPTLCKAILKTGKRAGQSCNSKIICNNDQFCKRHLSKH